MVLAVPETHLGIADAATVGVLTTFGADGYPQVTAIWFLREGEVFRTSLHQSRQKYRNLRATPRATLFVMDLAKPQRTIEVRGDVSIEDDPDGEFLDRLLAHYGMDPATFPAPRDSRVTVTITPTKINTFG
jgi:PPOX class probable F420-dependent enzyme